MGPFDELKIFTGNGHPQLAQDVCEYLDMPIGQAEVFKFSNDNTFVRILENIRQRDVFIIQPTCAPVNDNLMELLIMIDAAKRASAGRVTAVVPYYGYGRTDKKTSPECPSPLDWCRTCSPRPAQDRLLTVDLHAGQIQGFFNIPVDELTALTLTEPVLPGQEHGQSSGGGHGHWHQQRARDMAERLNAPLAIIEKRRLGNHDTARAST